MEDETVNLFDSSVVSSSGLVLNAKTYDAIDIDAINNTIETESHLIEQMYYAGFMTIEDVVNSMERFQKGLISQIRFLDCRTFGKSEDAKASMNILNDILNRTIKKARGHLYKPNFPEQYSRIEALVIKQEDAFHIKERKRSAVPDDKRTKEKFAALLFYIPLFENRGAHITSNDKDVLNLSATLFYTFTGALEDDYRSMALMKLSKLKPSIKNTQFEYVHTYPRENGACKTLSCFNRIDDSMKEDARKIIRMSYGISK
jgi:hypothetical protein